MLHEIVAATARSDHTVSITWEDGVRGVVDIRPYIARGGLFAALDDSDYFVREMRILTGGIGLSWPNEVDFSADGLRHEAMPRYREERSSPRKGQSTPSSRRKPGPKQHRSPPARGWQRNHRHLIYRRSASRPVADLQ